MVAFACSFVLYGGYRAQSLSNPPIISFALPGAILAKRIIHTAFKAMFANAITVKRVR